MLQPTVVVRDRETGHTYRISEARYRRTPALWDRLGSDPKKPKISVAKKAAAKKTASQVSETPDAPATDEKADEPANEEEN